MPIISCKSVDKKTYRVCITLGDGRLENLVITDDGLYSLYYIQNGKSHNHTGSIKNIVQNPSIPNNSYVLFDWSEDNSKRRERILFHQIQYIKDITPNDAYQIALKHGFQGTVDDWLESMRGLPGKNAYELAVDCGFVGTLAEWLESLKGSGSGGTGSGTPGKDGLSAYQIAVQNGFVGTEAEWLESLKGRPGADGLSAYQIAVANGYQGNEASWLEHIRGQAGLSAYEVAVKNGFVGDEEEWLESIKGARGDDGKSAYDLAVEKGFNGTVEAWLESLRGKNGLSAYDIAVQDYGFEGTIEDWMAANGDVTAVKKDVDTIKSSMIWGSTMM